MGGLSFFLSFYAEIRSGLMVTALDSGASGPRSNPDQGHCVVFLGKNKWVYKWVPANLMLGGNPAMD